MNNIVTKFKFMCTKILPTIFDDSLSYYEALCKISKKTNEVIEQVNKNTEILNGITDVETLVIDQTYNPNSKRAQSGTAVAEALGTVEIPDVVVDQTYQPQSDNAQSGKAVKEALDGIEITPTGIVDQTYNPNSNNAQSGKAVKEALDGIEVLGGNIRVYSANLTFEWVDEGNNNIPHYKSETGIKIKNTDFDLWNEGKLVIIPMAYDIIGIERVQHEIENDVIDTYVYLTSLTKKTRTITIAVMEVQ